MLKKSTLLLLTLTFSLLSISFNAGADAMEDILKSGKLRVGVSLFTPWAMKDGKGALTGFEVDVAKQLARDMGVKPEFHVFEWDKIISGLQEKQVDIIVAGMTITPQRALKINFSQPYAQSGVTMATNTEMTRDIKSLKELNSPDTVFAVVSGTTASELAKRTFNKAKVQDFVSRKKLLPLFWKTRRMPTLPLHHNRNSWL